MNFFQRQIAKVLWGKVLNSMPFLKRWTPIIGSAVLVLVVALRLLDQTALASAVEAVGSTLGITTQSPVSSAEIIAAATALLGIVRKVMAVLQKARAGAAA